MSITFTAPNTSTDRTITLPDGDISLGVGIDDNATSTAITIDASENVGIGTTDLKAKMAIGLTGVAITGDTDGATMGENAIAHLLDSNAGTTNSTVMLLGGGGGVTGQIKSGIGFSRENGSNWGTQLRFYTHSTATSDLDELNEAMRIDSSGNLGIGTPSPKGAGLSVGTTDATAIISAGGTNNHLTLASTGGGGGIRFYTQGGSSNNRATTESMQIDAAGHIGVGYAAVNGILDVRESWASKWAGRFENTSTTGLGILGITAATDGLYNLLELRKNTTEVVLKIRADGKAKSQFTAAGWVSIDGVGTVGINDSYNISSITDNGVGLYTINIDTNMLNGDYCVTAMCQGLNYSSAFACLHGAMSAGSFPIRVRTGTDAAYIDADEVMLTIFGDQ